MEDLTLEVKHILMEELMHGKIYEMVNTHFL